MIIKATKNYNVLTYQTSKTNLKKI